MRIYPIPRQLLTNPYLDQLYAPLESQLELRRVGVAQVLRETLKNPRGAIIHWHFFDELLQRRSRFATQGRSLAFMALIRLLKLRGIKQVWTAHNIEPHEVEHQAWAERVYRFMARHVDGIIAHSQAAANLLQQRYQIKTPLTVMPQGNYIDVYGPQQEQQASREQLGVPQAVFTALYLGYLRRYKGVELLIDAWNGVPGTLLIAGSVKEAAYAEELRAQAQQTPSIQLHMHYVPDSQLSTWIGAADVLVLPYRKLLTSAVLMWALSYAKPVIVPDVPTVRELITEGETGFLFEPENVQSLHAALQRAAHQADLQQLAQNAYELAAALPWEKSAAILHEVYRSILDPAPAP